jgi:peptide/nickel transport system substrate-binding protein
MSLDRLIRPMTVLLLCGIALSACGPSAAAPQTTAPAGDVPAAEETSSPLPGSSLDSGGRKVLRVIFTQEFDSLSPLYSSMWFSAVVQQLWMHWAWEYDENNQAFPRLVTEIPSVENGGISADGTVITMTLRSDIHWSDGTPITADDFLFTYEMSIDPANAVNSAYPYDQLESIEAPDLHTVVMKFAAPFAPWEATFWRGILPAHVLRPVFDEQGTLDAADWNRDPQVGCGPFLLAEWESGSFARFVVNENYWGERPKVDEVFIRFVPDDASQVAALVSGDADLGTFIAYNDIPTLDSAGIAVQTQPSGYNEGWFFVVSEEIGHPALNDVRVRKAIAMAFDREAIARDLLLGLSGVPASYWDSLPAFNNPPLESYPYDPEEARRLLDQAGWVDSDGDGVREKNGTPLFLTYGTPIREIRQDTQAVVQQQLAAVGVKVELITFDADIYFAGYGEGGPAAQGKIDIMQWSDSPYIPDPDTPYWLCSEIPSPDYPAGQNWQHLCDEELDGLFQLQASQVDPLERQRTFARINRIIYDRMYWLGLWQDPDVWAVGPRLGAVRLSGVTPFFDIVNWELFP